MSETSELVSELVRERDRYQMALEQAYQEMTNRDIIIMSLAVKLITKGKRVLALDNLGAVETKEYTFQASDDNKSGKLTIRNKPKGDSAASVPADKDDAE